jgi:hypothetical protein
MAGLIFRALKVQIPCNTTHRRIHLVVDPRILMDDRKVPQ